MFGFIKKIHLWVIKNVFGPDDEELEKMDEEYDPSTPKELTPVEFELPDLQAMYEYHESGTGSQPDLKRLFVKEPFDENLIDYRQAFGEIGPLYKLAEELEFRAKESVTINSILKNLSGQIKNVWETIKQCVAKEPEEFQTDSHHMNSVVACQLMVGFWERTPVEEKDN